MERLTTCSDWLISLLACSSDKLQLFAILVLVLRTLVSVDHCRSCLVYLTGSLPALALVRIDSLAPELNRSLTSWFLDSLSLFSAGMNSLTNIIKILRVFNRWASFNAFSKLLELSFSYLIFDLLLFNLSMINPSLQPLFQISSSMSVELLLISSSLPDSES